jgi:hypothetical protein
MYTARITSTDTVTDRQNNPRFAHTEQIMKRHGASRSHLTALTVFEPDQHSRSNPSSTGCCRSVLIGVPRRIGKNAGIQNNYGLTYRFSIKSHNISVGRSQWPRGLRRGSSAARLLGLWVRVPPRALISEICLCDGPIPRLEESCRVSVFRCSNNLLRLQ